MNSFLRRNYKKYKYSTNILSSFDILYVFICVNYIASYVWALSLALWIQIISLSKISNNNSESRLVKTFQSWKTMRSIWSYKCQALLSLPGYSVVPLSSYCHWSPHTIIEIVPLVRSSHHKLTKQRYLHVKVTWLTIYNS